MVSYKPVSYMKKRVEHKLTETHCFREKGGRGPNRMLFLLIPTAYPPTVL